MSKDTEYISTLIEFTVSEDNERVDLEACLEVADRANANKAECLEVIRSITKCLGKSSPKVVLNTIQLLETLCKNCNMRFLYELNNKKLIDALLKVIQRRRDRAKYGTKASKSSNPIKIETEDRILYLFQLWADTFMMHQSEFRNIHEAYRNLRKDGVQFPERDNNQKFMINFQGQVSPVFLAMENNFPVPSNNQGGPISDPNRPSQTFKPRPTEYRHEQGGVQNTLYDEDEGDYDYSAYDGIQITEEEVRILEESMNILREIERNAVKPADMKGEIAKEILSDLVHVHKRLKRFIKGERFVSGAQRNEAIKLSDVLSKCLSSYKTKYYKLKEDQQRRTRTEPDEDVEGRYEEREYARNAGKLTTDIGEGSLTERVRGGNEYIDPKKKPFKKANILNNKIAPPAGWKNPLAADSNLNGNPDLIDLLNTQETERKAQQKHNYEEKKEEPKANNEAKQDLFNDLLDLNFNTTPGQNAQNTNGNENRNGQMPTQVQNPNNVFSFNQFGNPGANTDMASLQQQFSAANISGQFGGFNNSGAQQNNQAVKANTNDDDDFFSDIANRKK